MLTVSPVAGESHPDAFGLVGRPVPRSASGNAGWSQGTLGSAKLGDMLLRGWVTGGTGGHAHWMTTHADLYEAKTGVRLYPGSLNVARPPLACAQPWDPAGAA